MAAGSDDPLVQQLASLETLQLSFDPQDLIEVAHAQQDKLDYEEQSGDDDQSLNTDGALEEIMRHHENKVGGGNRYNTGPKGVLSDFKDAQIKERKERERRRNEWIDSAYRSSMASTRPRAQNQDNIEGEHLEDAFLKTFRERRLRELQRQQVHSRIFGTVITLKSDLALLKAIDNEPPEVTVIVHLYENDHKDCLSIDSLLENLALKYGLVKFIRIEARIAQPDYDDIALPLILAYRNSGELITSIVRCMDELPLEVNEDALERLLFQYRILNPSLRYHVEDE